MPALSVVIPTYHRPVLLKRAVESALAACPSDAEIIVVDDRSDTAQAALASYATDPRLNIITNTGDKGAAGARNAGAQVATGTVILFFDDDDTLAPDYPQRVIAAATSSPASFGFSALVAIENGRTRMLDRPELPMGIIAPTVQLEHKMAAFSAGFWVRADVFHDVGGVLTDQIVDEDSDLCCRLYGTGHSAWYDPTPGCVVYRGYETGDGTAPQLTRMTAPDVTATCYMRTFQRNQGYFGYRSADRWFLLRRALRAAARAQADVVARALLRGLRPHTWQIKGWLFWQMKKLGQTLR